MDFQGNLIIDSLKCVQNKPGELTTSFPAELIYTHDDFVIGLKEAHLPDDLLKFESVNYFIVYESLSPSKKFVGRVPPMPKNQVLDFINAQLEKWNCGIERVEYDQQSRRTVIVASNSNQALLFTSELAHFLGFKTEAVLGKDWSFQFWKEAERAAYFNQFVKPQPIFDGPKEDPHAEKRYLFSENLRKFGPKLIFVHADCVKHHLLGNAWSQILEILPNKECNTFRFEKPCFYPLYCNRFDRITIKLTDERGKIIKTDQRILLVLEIKRFRE